MPGNSAEYQRAYRARKAMPSEPDPCAARIRDLEAEVAHLKRLLAERSLIVDHAFGHPRPAPK